MMTQPSRTAGAIYSGPGSVGALRAIVASEKCRRIAVVTDRGIAATGILMSVTRVLEITGVPFDVHTDALPEPPVASMESLGSRIRESAADLIIGIGGGSVLDTAKIAAVMCTNRIHVEEMIGIDRIPESGRPTVLIPTTAGTGSEVTPIAIVLSPDKRLKVGIVSPRLLAAHAILDPQLTVSLPPALTASTGMDAFIHSLESFLSRKASPLSDSFALESLRLINGSLERAFQSGDDLAARTSMLTGSCLGGMALAAAGTAAVHALSYPLGGRFNIPHGVANAMLLVPVMEHNADAVEDRMISIARSLGLADSRVSGSVATRAVLARIAQLVKTLAIPRHLSEFGVQASDLDGLSEAAMQVTRLLENNPKPMDFAAIRSVYAGIL